MENVKCALCGSGMHELLETRARYGLRVNTVICRACGLVFINPRMTMKEYEEFYSSPAYRKLYSNMETPTKEMDRRGLRGAREKFSFLSQAVDVSGFRKKSFLDIGCSAGYLPFIFHQKGWDAEGLEPTKTFAEHGRKKFGIRIRTGLLEKEKFDARYSFITLIHVFEHMTDPHLALKKLRSMLAEGGIIYIEVPNVHEFYGRFEQSCDIAHPYFYSPATLTAVMMANGFDIIKIVPGSSIRAFARKGAAKHIYVNGYQKTLAILRKRKRDYYLKGYFIFTPLFDRFSRFVVNHETLATAFKKLARAYSRSGLPFSRAVKELGAVE